MSEIRPQKKMQHNGHRITNASFSLFLDVLCWQGEEKRTLIKNSSHWSYETRFIHSSSTQNCKRLTVEWFATSVNLPKWASRHIFATAPALNNSVHCTSVLFHFYLFSPCQLSGAQIIVTVSTGTAAFFHIEPCSLGKTFCKYNNKEKQEKKGIFI